MVLVVYRPKIYTTQFVRYFFAWLLRKLKLLTSMVDFATHPPHNFIRQFTPMFEATEKFWKFLISNELRLRETWLQHVYWFNRYYHS
jgi:hypothetical protein